MVMPFGFISDVTVIATYTFDSSQIICNGLEVDLQSYTRKNASMNS